MRSASARDAGRRSRRAGRYERPVAYVRRGNRRIVPARASRGRVPAARLRPARIAEHFKNARRPLCAAVSARAPGGGLMLLKGQRGRRGRNGRRGVSAAVLDFFNLLDVFDPIRLAGFFRRSALIGAWEFKLLWVRPATYVLLLGAALLSAWSFSWLVTLLS